ncbi:MAG: carbonic anhydrase [Deltaproteobacteria bacterium]|nr:carbonic anhydrase [Deltaproteobacteria bacterium]
MTQSADRPVDLIETALFNNRLWATEIQKNNPEFFEKLSQIHAPSLLWIGCSDARVPANQLIGMQPGEVFVHRNIANQIQAADMNCLSVIEFAITVLRVQHILVVGHSDCGGVKAAIRGDAPELVSHWVRPIQRLFIKHMATLKELPFHEQVNALVRLNVIEQTKQLAQIASIRSAWQKGQQLTIHGWIYTLQSGLLEEVTHINNIAAADTILLKAE